MTRIRRKSKRTMPEPDAARDEVAPDAELADASPADESIDVDSAEVIEASGDAAAFIEQLQAELDEAVAARQRALADFKNYQRRAAENEERARSSATSSFIRAILPALDHFDLALGQDTEQLTVEQLISGVTLAREELTRILETKGITSIAPAPGDEFDPECHQAVMQQPSEEHPPSRILHVLQIGYQHGQQIIRPANVVVSAEPVADVSDEASVEE